MVIRHPQWGFASYGQLIKWRLDAAVSAVPSDETCASWIKWSETGDPFPVRRVPAGGLMADMAHLLVQPGAAFDRRWPESTADRAGGDQGGTIAEGAAAHTAWLIVPRDIGPRSNGLRTGTCV